MICGTFCLIPMVAGFFGWLIPYMFAKRLPTLRLTRQMIKGRKVLCFELSLETRETVRAMRRKDKPE